MKIPYIFSVICSVILFQHMTVYYTVLKWCLFVFCSMHSVDNFYYYEVHSQQVHISEKWGWRYPNGDIRIGLSDSIRIEFELWKGPSPANLQYDVRRFALCTAWLKRQVVCFLYSVCWWKSSVCLITSWMLLLLTMMMMMMMMMMSALHAPV